MNKETAKKAITNIYTASTLASMSAKNHELCKSSAKYLNDLIDNFEKALEEIKVLKKENERIKSDIEK